MNDPEELLTDLSAIALLASEKELEHEALRAHLREFGPDIDEIVIGLNKTVSAKIDCTLCGNCCRSLIIHVLPDEAERLAKRLEKSTEEIYTSYLEKGHGGEAVISRIPCHFLDGDKCSIYEDRFEDCRSFPHLDKPGFSRRIFSTLQYYGRCPIVFNVVEALKTRTGFCA